MWRNDNENHLVWQWRFRFENNKAGRYSYYHSLVDVDEYKKIKIEEYFDLYAQNKKEEILKKLELYPEMENRKKSKTAVEVVNMILGVWRKTGIKALLCTHLSLFLM